MQNLTSDTIVEQLDANLSSKLWWEAFLSFYDLTMSASVEVVCEVIQKSIQPNIMFFPFVKTFSLSTKTFLRSSKIQEANDFIAFVTTQMESKLNEAEKLFVQIETYRFLLFEHPEGIDISSRLFDVSNIEGKLASSDMETSNVIFSHYYSFLIQYYKLKGNIDLFFESMLKFYKINKDNNMNSVEKEMLLKDAGIVAMISKNYFRLDKVYYILNQNDIEGLEEIKKIFSEFIEGNVEYIKKVLEVVNLDVLKLNKEAVIFRTRIFRLYKIVREAMLKQDNESIIKLDDILESVADDEIEFLFIYTSAVENKLFDAVLDMEKRSLKILKVQNFVVKKEDIKELYNGITLLRERIKEIIKIQ